MQGPAPVGEVGVKLQEELLLSESSLPKVLALVQTCKELAVVIAFPSGFTQLRASDCLAPDHSSAQCVLVKIQQKEGAVLVRVDLWKKATTKTIKQFFWQKIMLHQEATILAYDGKAFLGCVLSAYKYIEIGSHCPPGSTLLGFNTTQTQHFLSLTFNTPHIQQSRIQQ